MAKRGHELVKARVIARRKDGLDEPIGGLKLSELEFELDRDAVAALDEDLNNLHRHIRNDNIRYGIQASKIQHCKVPGVVLTTDTETIPHSLQQIPFSYSVIPKSAGVWLEAKTPDIGAIYLQASSGSMTVDVIIQG